VAYEWPVAREGWLAAYRSVLKQHRAYIPSAI
jgi:hypothetical protein